MSAPAAAQGVGGWPQIGPRMAEIALRLTPSETSRISTRRCGCCADGMDVSTYTAVEGVGL